MHNEVREKRLVAPLPSSLLLSQSYRIRSRPLDGGAINSAPTASFLRSLVVG